MSDTYDILTETEALKAALTTDGTAHTSQIARMNTAVSRRIDELCGPVVKRAVTEYHDGGIDVIHPRKTPVATVTTLKEWDGTTVITLTADTWGTAGNADGYWLDQSDDYAHDCTIERRSNGDPANFPTGSDTVELVYSAGRYADTASVDARFKECAAAIIRRAWDRDAGAWARADDPFEQGIGSGRFFKAIDPMIAEWLDDEMRPPGVG